MVSVNLPVSLCFYILVCASLMLLGHVQHASAQPFPSPWYQQDLKTSSISSSTTDILATTDNGTHIFVMTADDYLHLFSYSASGGPATSVGFIGKYSIHLSVQHDISSGLNWRTSSAFALEYNKYTSELYAIKYTYNLIRRLNVFVLDSRTFNDKFELKYSTFTTGENYWQNNFQNPRLSTFLDSSYLYVGIFNDPAITGATGTIGFWISRTTYVTGSVSADADMFNLTQKVLEIDFQCNMDPTIICVWTSQNTVDEYSFASFTYLRTRTINSTPMKFNPSIAKNTSDKMTYFFHRSVNLAGNPFVLHKRNETYQQMSSAVLPYQISFSDSIPEFGVRVGSNSSAFVGFTTTLNTSIAYGDFETVVSQHNAADLGLQGQMIISTVGKENFAAVIPQANNGFIVIGRTNGNLNSPSSATGSTVIFATQFGPLRVNSFVSAKPMQVSPSEVVQVQFESVPSSLTATIPTVTFNGLACSSVSWSSSNTLSVQMPSDVAGAGPYDLWISFNSISYKPSVKVPGILAHQLKLLSVQPVNGSTVGYNITLLTSDIGIVSEQIAITVGGKLCANPSQLNNTAFRCTTPPGTGKNKLVIIAIGASANSSELVYINYYRPVITAVSPPTSPTTGGRMIYISGTGFGPCSVGAAPCDATAENISISIGSTPCYLPKLQSDSSVTCITPELVGQNLSLSLQVNGQAANSVSFSYDLPRISSVVPQWILSGNPTMYIEGSNFGPVYVNRTLSFHEHNTTQTFVCPVVTWLAHNSLKCEFTNVSLPLYSRFNITVSVEGYQNPDTNVAEFRTGFLNVAPVIPPLHAVMKEDELLFLELSSYDPDAGDTIQIFVSSNPQFGTLFQITPAGTKGSLIDASLGVVPVLHSQSRLLYIPPANFFGNDSFKVFATDDKGSQSAAETITITVEPVPDPPVPRSAVINLDEDTTAVVEFKVDDPDQTNTDSIALTILAVPQFGSLMIQNVSGNSSNWIEVLNVPFVLPINVTSTIFRPLNDTNGSPYGTVIFKANDGLTDSVVNGSIVLNVNPVNDPPVFDRGSWNTSVFEDTPATIVFNITDVDQNDLVVVKIYNLSISGSLYPLSQNLRDLDITKSAPLGEGSEIKGPPYQLLFVPLKDVFTSNASIPQRFDLAYSDRVTSFSEEISFSITPVNDPPQLSCNRPTYIELSTEFITNTSDSVSVRIDATDVDNTNLTYVLIASPTKGNLIAGMNAVFAGDNFTSQYLQYRSLNLGGIYPFANFTLTVQDSYNLSSDSCTYIFSFKCPPGLVNNVFSHTGPICGECPEGAVCSSDGSQYPYPKFGWWRSEDNTTFLPCFPMNACPGNPFLPCSVGYEGTRCGRCSPGYYRFTDGCHKCGEQSGAIQYVIIGCILVFVASAFIFVLRISREKRGATFGLVSILVNFIQTILLLRQMRLNWPEAILTVFSWLSFINFNVELASPECLVTEQSFDFSFKMKLSLSIPVIVLIIALLMPGVSHLINLVKPNAMDNSDGNRLVRVVKAYMSVLSLLFVHVATSSLALFDCTQEADNLSYLDSDPSLRCYEPWYYRDLPYGYAGLVLYVLGIPFQSVIVSYAARRARKDPSNSDSIRNRFPLFCQKIMDSSHEFKEDYQFISVLQLFQKLFMVVVNIFFTRYIGLQIILTLFFLLSSVLLVLQYQPYEFPILNKFDMLSNLVSMIVLGLGLTFHIDKFSNSTHELAIMVLIIIVISGFIVSAVIATFRESFSSFVRRGKFGIRNGKPTDPDANASANLTVTKSSRALLI